MKTDKKNSLIVTILAASFLMLMYYLSVKPLNESITILQAIKSGFVFISIVIGIFSSLIISAIDRVNDKKENDHEN